MMQQIATKNTDLAASALPFDVKVEPTDSTEFSLVLKEQSQTQMSAFEQARQRTEKLDSKSISNAAERNNRNARSDRSDNGNNSDRNNEVSSNGSDAEENTVIDEDMPVSDNEHRELKNKISDGNDIVDDNNNQEPVPREGSGDDDFAVTQDNREKLAQILAQGKDDFDYISFVSEMKLINEGELETDAKLENLIDDIVEEPLTQFQLDNELLTEDVSDESPINIEELDETAADFAVVHLAEEQIAAILASQENLQTDSGENLSLKEVVKSIIEQFSASDEKSADTNESDAELDLELVETVLQQPTEISEDIELLGQRLIETEAPLINIAELPEGTLEAIAQAANALNASDNAKIALAEQDVLGQTLNQDVLEQVINTKTEVELTTSAKSVEIKINPLAENNKKALLQLAELDSKRLEKTLENVQQRLEKLIPELSGDTKGKEFIAALQSGIKEFKEQLSQGREPGIDLKSLVAEASGKVDVEIPVKVSAKLDQSLSQFSTMLNLASGVQQSQQLQASQLLTQAEAIAAEKISQSLTEGTKLAQSSSNASNIDKAVNIFKPEGQMQLTEKVRWMLNARNPAAEIRLDPPELGAMQIRLNLNGDTASVNFAVQSIQAKDALDQALPKLREMLQEQGIELGQSSVQQESNGSGGQDFGDEQESTASTSGSALSASENAEDSNEQFIEQRVSGNVLGGIDYYA